MPLIVAVMLLTSGLASRNQNLPKFGLLAPAYLAEVVRQLTDWKARQLRRFRGAELRDRGMCGFRTLETSRCPQASSSSRRNSCWFRDLFSSRSSGRRFLERGLSQGPVADSPHATYRLRDPDGTASRQLSALPGSRLRFYPMPLRIVRVISRAGACRR